ncbi:hypothetical protein Scep_028653 [Stephania cephalantha]|uniref:non-specific serine/threonine protein kinase n=1 Tax=Stephania cephalantha TaxID=152367 RepID=A0AAP0EAC7_9MAGN
MALLLALLIVCHTLFTTHLCSATDTITHNTTLRDGDTIVSNGGTFALGFFSPGNSRKRYIGIWYNKVSEQTVVWVANRANPINSSSSGLLRIDSRPNLVIFDGNQTNPVWSNNVSIPITEKTNPSSLFYKLLDSGNLVLVDENRGNRGSPVFLWQSFDYPTHTMLPGMKIGVNLKSGLNWTLTSWKSPDDPSIGDYSTWVDRSGPPEFFLRSGSRLIWRTGVWNLEGWSGIPRMLQEDVLNYSFVNSPDEISFSYIIYNTSIFSRFYLDDLGTIQRSVWLDSGRRWNRFWEAPGDRCDNFGGCGAFGMCNPNNAWICSCFPGFEPKSPKDWNNLDRSQGCVRKRVCDNGDGFLRLLKIKIPDASNARVNMSMSIKDCEGECRKNCSCTGYASVGGNGDVSSCLMWFGDLVDIREYLDGGQEFFLRVDAVELANAATTSQSKGSSSRKKLVLIGVLVVVGSLIFVAAFYYFFRRVKRRGYVQRKRHPKPPFSLPISENYEEASASFELPSLDLDTMIVATENFSPANKLGTGGFGSVYKGKLPDGRQVAVKRLSKNSGQGVTEFKNEVMVIAKLQHRNLVQIIGCCVTNEEKILIYEYMPNKSLDFLLFGMLIIISHLLLFTIPVSSFPKEEVMKFIQVGILCVQENAKDRPTMSSVIFMLDNETTIPIPKQPAFVLISKPNSPSTSTTGTGSHSISEMSTTIIEGRVKAGPSCIHESLEVSRTMLFAALMLIGKYVATEKPTVPDFVYFFNNKLCSATNDTITQNKFLRDGDTLVSHGGIYALGFFSPGNSQKRYVGIWFNKVSEQTVVWVANRNNPVNESSSGVVKIDGRGNLAIFNGNASNSVWSTNISIKVTKKASSALSYKLLDSGNLVLVQENKSDVLWQSFDYPTDTLKFGFNWKLGLNWSLTSWKSRDDPSNGDFVLIFNTRGAPDGLIRNGSRVIWRTGPWNGRTWNGIPRMSTNFLFHYSFINNSNEIYFSYGSNNNSVFDRLQVDDLGFFRRSSWLEDSHRWNEFYSAPGDACDHYGKCGAFGSCNANNAQICSCVPGYEPKSQKDWYLKDGSQGCVRKRELSCGKGDGFLKLEKVKLPDTSNAGVDMSLGIKDCETECRNNCSCTGYSSAYVDGSGCIGWFGDLTDVKQFTVGGQDLFVRVDAIELGNSTRHSKGFFSKKNLVLLCVLIVVGLLALIFAFYYLFGRAKTRGLPREERSLHELLSNLSNEETNAKFDLPIFDLDAMMLATDNFSLANKLGSGGFGSVYKGKLSDGREIAVKRLSKNSGQGIIEFKNEVVLIAKLQHRNLVQILGCCIDKEEKIGYMSPEYAMDGLFSIKSDVFSFGVLLLEIISGKKNSGFYCEDHSMNLIKHAWELWRDGRPLELVDRAMGTSFPEQDVVKFIQVGILCIQENANDRPTMSSVIFMLSNETTIPTPEQPAFILTRRYRHPNSSTTGTSSCSVNEMSTSIMEGR